MSFVNAEDFPTEYKALHPMFKKMPMYGIENGFDLGWVKQALKQGKQIYGEKFYDSKYPTPKNLELENSFSDIPTKYYSGHPPTVAKQILTAF